MSADQVDKVAAFVADSSVRGLKVEDLIAATGWKREFVTDIASRSLEQGILIEAGGLLLSPENFDHLSTKVLNELESHHKREPLARGMLRETLREKVFAHSLPELFGAVIGKLEAAGKLFSEKDIVRAASHRVDLSSENSLLREKLEQVYLGAGVEAPSIDEAFTRAGIPASSRLQGRKILQLLIDDMSIVRVNNDMFIHRRTLDDLKSKLLNHASQNEPHRLIDVAAFKDLAGVSRKYAIPLLEYFDRERVTRRTGDKRLILKP
jgi:selenocysteine-specific elongation factor